MCSILDNGHTPELTDDLVKVSSTLATLFDGALRDTLLFLSQRASDDMTLQKELQSSLGVTGANIEARNLVEILPLIHLWQLETFV